MLSRRSFGKAAGMGALGGLPPRRPDQVHDPAEHALGAGPRSIGPQPFVVIFGTGRNRGLFVYSPTPGKGKLIASVTAANSVDKFGNATLGGVVFYDPVAFTAIEMGSGGQTALAWWSAPSQAGPYTLVAEFLLRDLNELDLFLAGTAPGLAQFVISNHSLIGAQTSQLLEVQGNIAYGGSSAATIAVAGTDANGYPQVTDAGGLLQNVSGCQPAARATNTILTATFGSLTSFTIPANEPEAGATYELETGGYGNVGTTPQNLTLQPRFGASPGAASDVVGTAAVLATSGFSISHAFQWSAKVKAVCNGSGAGATWRIFLAGTITDTTNATISSTTSIAFAVGTGSADITQDSTAAIVMGLSAEWAATTGAPTISKSSAEFGRRS